MPINTHQRPNSKKPNIIPSAQMSKDFPIECDDCHKAFYLRTAVRRKEFDYTNDEGKNRMGGIIEIGLVCPHCEHYFHSYYTNAKLEQRVKQITNRRRLRAFQRDFDKWQLEVKEMLAQAQEV